MESMMNLGSPPYPRVVSPRPLVGDRAPAIDDSENTKNLCCDSCILAWIVFPLVCHVCAYHPHIADLCESILSIPDHWIYVTSLYMKNASNLQGL